MNRRRPRHLEALARGPGTCSTRSTTAFPSPLAPSWRHLGRDQVPDAHQVVQRGSQGKQPPHAAHPPVTGFPEEGHGLEPAEHLRSEEHTSELQSQSNLVCRLLLEKKKQHN